MWVPIVDVCRFKSLLISLTESPFLRYCIILNSCGDNLSKGFGDSFPGISSVKDSLNEVLIYLLLFKTVSIAVFISVYSESLVTQPFAPSCKFLSIHLFRVHTNHQYLRFGFYGDYITYQAKRVGARHSYIQYQQVVIFFFNFFKCRGAIMRFIK